MTIFEWKKEQTYDCHDDKTRLETICKNNLGKFSIKKIKEAVKKASKNGKYDPWTYNSSQWTE